VDSSNPLDNFPVIRSRNIDEVCEAIGRFFARPLWATAPGGNLLDATINNCRLQNIALAYACYGAPLTLEYPSTSLFVQLFPVRGAAAINRGASSGTLRPGLGTLILPGAPYTMNYGAEYAHLVLRLDAPALTRKLAAMTGADIHEPLRVQVEQESRHPAAYMLKQYLPLVVETLSKAEPPYPDWWVLQTEQLLMTLFLCGHQHNYSHLLETEAPTAAPNQVRRAEEYIEANALRGVGLDELAAVTGASEFSLYRSFKHSRGYSPMEFAARQRAKRAKRRSAEC
jgi:AraC-like protein